MVMKNVGMSVKHFIKSKFGKDIFSLSDDDILRERIRLEKMIEKLSDDIKRNEEKIQKLMVESKGQSMTLKMLNVQKIKSLRLEARAKQQEASTYLKQLQLLMLITAMKQREKKEISSEIINKILNSNVEEINRVLLDTDVQKALEEGKVDIIRERLESVFGKEEMLMDEESREILKSIEDLEEVDEETAIEIAREKARKLTELKPEEEKESV